MNNLSKFGTALNCIDGRVQAPVAEWIKLHSQVQFVDMVTEPGIDRVLSEGTRSAIYAVSEKLRISIEVHRSVIVAVVGHFDCAANNVSFEEHEKQILESIDLIASWNLRIRLVGLYVNEWNSIDVICDSNDDFAQIRSFL